MRPDGERLRDFLMKLKKEIKEMDKKRISPDQCNRGLDFEVPTLIGLEEKEKCSARTRLA